MQKTAGKPKFCLSLKKETDGNYKNVTVLSDVLLQPSPTEMQPSAQPPQPSSQPPEVVSDQPPEMLLPQGEDADAYASSILEQLLMDPGVQSYELLNSEDEFEILGPKQKKEESMVIHYAAPSTSTLLQPKLQPTADLQMPRTQAQRKPPQKKRLQQQPRPQTKGRGKDFGKMLQLHKTGRVTEQMDVMLANFVTSLKKALKEKGSLQKAGCQRIAVEEEKEQQLEEEIRLKEEELRQMDQEKKTLKENITAHEN